MEWFDIYLLLFQALF